MPKKRTHEQFIEDMNKINPNIEILNKYVKAKIKVKCRCKLDGYEWEATPDNLLHNKGCPICGNKTISNKLSKSHNDFINKIKEINPNIEILGEYVNNHTKIKCRCRLDGYEWEAIPNNLTSKKQGCSKCFGNNKKTHEEFIQEMRNINDNIEIISKYININTKVKCRCKLDGCEWEARPDHLLEEHGCPKCAIRNNSGENNPRWNPNLTQEEREIKRNFPEYKEWRTEVYERDNYTCQVTGIRGGDLVVHHLYSYNKYYCLRTAIENGITVSKDIHDLFHSIYGYGDNTLEQWEEFINNLTRINFND